MTKLAEGRPAGQWRTDTRSAGRPVLVLSLPRRLSAVPCIGELRQGHRSRPGTRTCSLRDTEQQRGGASWVTGSLIGKPARSSTNLQVMGRSRN